MLASSQAGSRPGMPGAAPYDTSMPDFLRQVAPGSSLGSSALVGAPLNPLGSSPLSALGSSDHPPVTPAYEKAAAALNFKVASGSSFVMDSDSALAPTGPPPGQGLAATMEAVPDASGSSEIKAKDLDLSYGGFNYQDSLGMNGLSAQTGGYGSMPGASGGEATGPSSMYGSTNGISSLGGYAGLLGALPGETNGSNGLYSSMSAPYANGSNGMYGSMSAAYAGTDEAALPTQQNAADSSSMTNPFQTSSVTGNGSSAAHERGATPLPYGRGRVSNGAGMRSAGSPGYESGPALASSQQQPNGTYSEARTGVSEPAGSFGFPSAGSFVAEAYADDGLPAYLQRDKMHSRSEAMAAAMAARNGEGARSAANSPMRGATSNGYAQEQFDARGPMANGYARENGYGAYPPEYGFNPSYQSRTNQYSASAPSMRSPNLRSTSPMDRGGYGRSDLVPSGSFVASPYADGAPPLDMFGSTAASTYTPPSMTAYRGRSESPMGARNGYGLATSGSFVASPYADGAPAMDMLGGMAFGGGPTPLSMGGFGDLYGQSPSSTTSSMYGGMQGQQGLGFGYPGTLGSPFDGDPFKMSMGGAGSFGMGPQRGSFAAMGPSSSSFAAMGPQTGSFLASVDTAQPSISRGGGVDSPMPRPGDTDGYASMKSNGASKNGTNGLDGPPRGLDGPPRSTMRKDDDDLGPAPGPAPPKARSGRSRDRDGNPPRIKKKSGRGCC